ncbi:MAG TPA: hypothetical protein VLH79_09895 [Chthonomonadales bacterium]|nr:hypothetical protein [Chthonomonadales bacterium]
MDSRRAVWALLVLAFGLSCIAIAIIGAFVLPTSTPPPDAAAPPGGPLATALTGAGVAAILAGLGLFYGKVSAHERALQSARPADAAAAFQTTTVLALALIEVGPMLGILIRFLTGSSAQLLALAVLAVLAIAGGVLPRGLAVWASARHAGGPPA